jgi:ferredoxin
MAKIKVRINKENCLSCGSCYASTPEVFEIDPADAKAAIVEQFREVEITDDALIAKIKATKELCPNGAIEVEDIA